MYIFFFEFFFKKDSKVIIKNECEGTLYFLQDLLERERAPAKEAEIMITMPESLYSIFLKMDSITGRGRFDWEAGLYADR